MTGKVTVIFMVEVPGSCGGGSPVSLLTTDKQGVEVRRMKKKPYLGLGDKES